MKTICERSKALFLIGAILALVSLPLAAQDAHARLTATQSLYVELEPRTGEWMALGTIVVDLAAGPRWNWTYIHDRGMVVDGRWSQHELSLTRVLWRDTTATLGVRIKTPEDGSIERYHYGLIAWRWGN